MVGERGVAKGRSVAFADDDRAGCFQACDENVVDRVRCRIGVQMAAEGRAHADGFRQVLHQQRQPGQRAGARMVVCLRERFVRTQRDDAVERRVGRFDPPQCGLHELPRREPSFPYGGGEGRAAHSAGSNVSATEVMQ